MIKLLVHAWVVVAVAACVSGDSTRRDTEAATVRDSAGVTIVENTVVEPAGIPTWRIDTVPAVTIGKTSGESAYEFGTIGGLRRMPNGMVVVLTGQGESAFEFRFFDSTGTHVVTHGKRGQGPGDYRWVTYFAPVGGDTLVAVDFPNSRIYWLTAASGHLRSARLDDGGFKKVLGDDASGMFETMVPLGDSVYAVKAFRRIQGSSSPFQRATTYHILDLKQGTAPELIRYQEPPMKEVQLSTGPTSLYPMNAGSDAHVVDRARRRICASLSSTPQINCIDDKGKRMIIRWKAETVPYTEADRRAAEESFRRMRLGSRTTSQDVEKLLAAREWPERFNPFMVLQIDADGNFWVSEYTLDSAGKRKSRFRVFGPDGKQVAFADPFPVRSFGLSNPVDIGSDAVLRVIENADGAQVIGVFPIKKQ
jgi:hypothetical protein